jgi:hypothetical protein
MPGKVTYRRRIDPTATAFTASPWAYNGKVFLLDEEGQSFVVAAGEKFELQHTNLLEGMVRLVHHAGHIHPGHVLLHRFLCTLLGFCLCQRAQVCAKIYGVGDEKQGDAFVHVKK